MAMSVSERTRRVVPVVQGIADFKFKDAFGVLRVWTWKLGNAFVVVGGAWIELAAPLDSGFGSAYCSFFALCAGFGVATAD